MNRLSLKFMWLLATAPLTMIGCAAEVAMAPPPGQIEIIPASPYAQAVWMNGYWSWSGGRHVWVSGRYVQGRPGHVWVGHSWERGQRGWHIRQGYWRRM